MGYTPPDCPSCHIELVDPTYNILRHQMLCTCPQCGGVFWANSDGTLDEPASLVCPRCDGQHVEVPLRPIHGGIYFRCEDCGESWVIFRPPGDTPSPESWRDRPPML